MKALVTFFLLLSSIPLCAGKASIELIREYLIAEDGVPRAEEAKHLFILSGQSNMAGLKPQQSFTPEVEKRFGKEKVIVVHDAQGGQPIRRWFKGWKPLEGAAPEGNGDLYDRLMKKVSTATKGQEIASVTFLWMQGENDARHSQGAVYEVSLKGLVGQVSDDLKQERVNLVIGRLSDFGNEKPEFPHWEMIRKAQEKFAEDAEHGAWVDTDDLNDGITRQGKEVKNDLHYTAEGYITFGKRLAEAAIKLIGEK